MMKRNEKHRAFLLLLLFVFFLVQLKVYSLFHNQMLDLVRATVAVITTGCAIEVIDVVRAAVSHLNVGCLPTTVWWIMIKADLPGYSAISHCGMSTI